MREHVRNTAAELKLPFGEREKTYNSRLAQELGKWAEEKGQGDPFHRAVFKAYFADTKNIAKIPVLVDLAGSVGLDRKEAGTVLSSRAYRDSVDADWSLSAAKGITSIPTFMLNQYKLVGAQPYEMLERLMEVSGVRKKNEVE
jgi:predicted DsbA family dithiol-disulfide isomerase